MALCDHKSVGVIIEGMPGYAGPADHYLMFERVKPPHGIAPVAGHLDDHGSYLDAMQAETVEETGLEVVEYHLVANGWRGNACRRQPANSEVGHDWKIYKALALGDQAAAPAETKNLHWYSRGDIAEMAARTMLYALDYVTGAEFKAEPGIEPVWIQWLIEAQLLDPKGMHLELLDALTETTPSV